ncbi:hypothetical protein [Paraburkholderia tagetis]|uniref:Uncharacterized protein n=1 Tax=Paraburkholderia tagetis TaxID=2913261 RepID=A0A9X1RS94_9BURK|nr:hypothetical protein [Paraburkholderia tagetis]MCG5075965.1 hypothetical protein [Paraburkholderia tagetis]
MAIDFALLPPEEPVSESLPSRLFWTVAFLVIAIVGVFAVLLLWPKGESTETPWFWTCVTVYPFGLSAFVVLRRYSVYEGRRLDAIAWNDARADYVNGVFDRASRPLGVLAANCRFSCQAGEDDFGKLLDGYIKLEPRTAPKPDVPPVAARWFEILDTKGIPLKWDVERRDHVLSWAFSTVTDTVADAVRSLPLELMLKVQLVLPGIANTDEALAIWNRQWAKADVRPAQTRVLGETPDLMYADTWLDRANEGLDWEARLLVFVRLNAVPGALPPDQSAETVVAVLLAPEAVCGKFKLSPVAMLHRPTRDDDCSVDDALAHAMRWGCMQPAELKHVWKGGVGADNANAATKAIVKVGISAKTADIDYMVGRVGEVAPWFAVACAAGAAAADRTPQLVMAAGKAGTCFSVLRNIHREIGVHR